MLQLRSCGTILFIIELASSTEDEDHKITIRDMITFRVTAANTDLVTDPTNCDPTDLAQRTDPNAGHLQFYHELLYVLLLVDDSTQRATTDAGD